MKNNPKTTAALGLGTAAVGGGVAGYNQLGQAAPTAAPAGPAAPAPAPAAVPGKADDKFKAEGEATAPSPSILDQAQGLPGWQKALITGGLGLGGGMLGHYLTKSDDEEDEGGMPWGGLLGGAAGLAGGAAALTGGDFSKVPDWFRSKTGGARRPLVLVPYSIDLEKEGQNPPFPPPQPNIKPPPQPVNPQQPQAANQPPAPGAQPAVPQQPAPAQTPAPTPAPQQAAPQAQAAPAAPAPAASAPAQPAQQQQPAAPKPTQPTQPQPGSMNMEQAMAHPSTQELIKRYSQGGGGSNIAIGRAIAAKDPATDAQLKTMFNQMTPEAQKQLMDNMKPGWGDGMGQSMYGFDAVQAKARGLQLAQQWQKEQAQAAQPAASAAGAAKTTAPAAAANAAAAAAKAPGAQDPNQQIQNTAKELAAANPQAAQSPGFMQQVMDFWNKLPTEQKWMIGGGLGLGALSMLSGKSMGGMGWLGPLLGVGALGYGAYQQGMFDKVPEMLGKVPGMLGGMFGGQQEQPVVAGGQAPAGQLTQGGQTGQATVTPNAQPQEGPTNVNPFEMAQGPAALASLPGVGTALGKTPGVGGLLGKAPVLNTALGVGALGHDMYTGNAGARNAEIGQATQDAINPDKWLDFIKDPSFAGAGRLAEGGSALANPLDPNFYRGMYKNLTDLGGEGVGTVKDVGKQLTGQYQDPTKLESQSSLGRLAEMGPKIRDIEYTKAKQQLADGSFKGVDPFRHSGGSPFEQGIGLGESKRRMLGEGWNPLSWMGQGASNVVSSLGALKGQGQAQYEHLADKMGPASGADVGKTTEQRMMERSGNDPAGNFAMMAASHPVASPTELLSGQALNPFTGRQIRLNNMFGLSGN